MNLKLGGDVESLIYKAQGLKIIGQQLQAEIGTLPVNHEVFSFYANFLAIPHASCRVGFLPSRSRFQNKLLFCSALMAFRILHFCRM